MMVPAPVQAEPQCTETVEYITEYVPAKRRTYRRPTKIVSDKRIRVAPDKRVYAK